MPQIPYTPPADVLQACHEGLEDLMGCTRIIEQHVLPSYVIGLKECCTGNLKGAGFRELTGWKIVVEDAGGRVLTADVVRGGESSAPELTGASESGYSRKILQAIRELGDKLKILPDENPTYELRWLSIPAIVAEGLWLHAPVENQMSWVSPVLDLPAGISGIPFLPFVDLVMIASQLGKIREEADDEPLYLNEPVP